jgi:hypothetical protein
MCFVLEDGALYCAGLRYLPENGVGVLGQSRKLERVLPRCVRSNGEANSGS